MTTNLRIKKKHLDAKAVDGSKIELQASEALKAVSSGQIVDLIKIEDTAEGKVLIKGSEVAYKADVSTEASSRVAADGSLTSRVSSEESSRAAAVSTEASSRVAGDNSLQSRLSLEEVARANADTLAATATQAAFQAEAAARVSIDNSLESRVSVEEAARISADTSLEGRIAAKIADLAGAAPGLLSALGQVEAALSDSDAATGMLNAIAAESSLRTAADGSLTSRVSSEESSRAAAVSTEASSRVAGDNSLQSRLSAEESSRAAAVSTEASSRTAADDSLTSRLSTEESIRSAAVSTEASSRVAADTSVLDAAKAYVDDVIGVDSTSVANFLNLAATMEDNLATTGLIDAVAGIANGHAKESIALVEATHLSAGVWSVVLAEKVKANSVVMSVNRLMIHEGVDFSLSTVAVSGVDKTKVTFTGELAVGGAEALTAGDVIYVKYMK